MIIGVHGFDYDPADPNCPLPSLFQLWQLMVARPIKGFFWNSGRLTIRGEETALAAGFIDQYAWSYQKLSVVASERLTKMLDGVTGGIGHSLGTRVWSLALSTLPTDYKGRFLFLNGAALANDIEAIKLPDGVEILNICVRGDLVLRDLGSRFSGTVGSCIGSTGVNLPGWRNLFIDDPETQARVLDKRGWDIQGVPLDRLDVDPVDTHSYSYAWKGNWPLYRTWFDGDNLTDIIP